MVIFFYLFSALIILGSIGVITARNPVYAVLWLIFTFLNSSAIFIQLGAEFIAMTVVIVYVGAVAVLFLFVVMMLNISFTFAYERILANRLLSSIIASALIIDFILIIKSSLSQPILVNKTNHPISVAATNTHNIGNILYTDYLVVFELAGLVLLLAMIGCIILTLRSRDGVKKQNATTQIARTEQNSVKLMNVPLRAGIDGITYKQN